MRFAFTDFFQDGPFRVFVFEKLPKGEGQSKYWVKADLSIARGFRISVQELPLLCRDLLEAGIENPEKHTIVYTAEDMKRHATKCADIAAQRKSYSLKRAAAAATPAVAARTL